MTDPLVHPELPYHLVTDLDAFDMDAIFAYLSGEAYWSKGISRTLVDKAWSNSLPFGVMTPDGEQVGACRVVTDRATYAYLADVYLLEAHRGKGLAIWMMEAVMAHPDLQDVRRFMLATSNMHSLYQKFGFAGIANPSILMEKLGEGAYRGEQ